MSIRIDREITRDLSRSAGMEWLETNGLGGWAGTTVAGLHSRRCHGLLVAATEPPGGRAVLLSRLDETLHLAGETFELSCNQFPGAIVPRGFEHLASFSKDLFPVFEYEAGGIRLRKTVAAVDGENTTLVLYEVLEAPGPFLMSLRPFVAGRHQHALAHANPALSEETSFAEGVLRLHPHADLPEVFLRVPGAEFRANPQWWYRFEYELDRRRGADFQEDLWTPGLFGCELAPGDRLGIVLSTLDPRGRDAFELLDRERRRREKVVRAVPVQDEVARSLALAADGFLVRRGNPQKGLRTVVAAYPAPGERSRDTMIALPGLCLATGRHEEAKKILRAFAKSLDRGLFPGDDAIDAPLWLFVAGYRFFQATGDEAFARGTLLPALRKVVHAFDRGTRYGIRVDEDGLLLAPEPDVPLTWMDAVVAGRPVTPRAGKAVEVEALWYNALYILAELEALVGDPAEANFLEKRARRVQKRFAELFWDEERGCLYDGIDVDGRPDAALRPNQVIALGLPFQLLPKPRAARVLKLVEERLYTPVGLRTLAPGEPGYAPTCEGDDGARERAAHQGTVWTWLLGPFFTALVRIHGAAGRRKARRMMEALRPWLAEGGVGSLSGRYDAEPPHTPRGSIARAWSVAEVLRAWTDDLQEEGTPQPETQAPPRRARVKKGDR